MARRDEDNTNPPVDRRVARTRNDVLAAAHRVLVDEGPFSLTHQHVAEVAGYSKATIHTHWPARAELLRDVFARLHDMTHSTPTGDLRTDLIQELTEFRTAIAKHGIDRALAVLASLAVSEPDLISVRDALVTEGERIMRMLLAPVLNDPDLEAAVLMLSGGIFYGALLHKQLPTDDVIESAVDVTLKGIGWPDVASR